MPISSATCGRSAGTALRPALLSHVALLPADLRRRLPRAQYPALANRAVQGRRGGWLSLAALMACSSSTSEGNCMAHTKILFRGSAREKVLQGATQLADAIRVTLGPKSKSVLIQKKWGTPQ